MTDLPFKEEYINGFYYRTFNENVNDLELVWHQDREDRLIDVIENNGWKFQFDNELPILLNDKIYIPKYTYHRIIKGTGKLILKIKKI